MKKTNKLLLLSMILSSGAIQMRGQNVFPTGVGTSVGIGTNAPASRLQVVGGDARFGSTANYAQHGADGDLTFTGNADFLVGANKYAFRYSGDQDYGLFFNQTSLRYEFRNATAAAIFYASTTGDGYFAKGVQIGNSTINTAGNIRWNGTDFEGYNGTVWKSFTVTGGGAETDPQVGANTTNIIPRWNGSALIGGSIYDDGTNIGIGTSSPTQKLHVDGNILTTGGVTAIAATINGRVNLSSINGSAAFEDNNLTIVGLSGSQWYPAISLTIEGDGNQVYGTTTSIGLLIQNVDGSAYSPVNASAFNVSSDRTLKKDITEIKEDSYDVYLDQIRDIESITYRYNNEEAAAGVDSKAPVREFPHVGFAAQSLPDAIQTKIPVSGKVGAEMKLGYNLSDMAGLTLLGIKAVDAKTQILEKQVADLINTEAADAKTKGLEKLVADLQTTVKDLENSLASCCSNFSTERNAVDNLSVPEQARLEQNAPNPFSEKTTINYYIPSNVKNAMVKIYSLNGDAIKTINIAQTGKGSVEVNGGSLAAGTYTYQLILDGKTIDTKLMVITK
jgi:Chaperone of endosialidase